MRIIISRTDNIGDVVLTLPMASLLKQRYPKAQIIVLARAYVEAVVMAHPAVDEFVDWETLQTQTDADIVAAFKALNADIILHVFPNTRIAKCAAQAKIPLRIGTNRRWYHWLYCNRLVNFSRKNSHLHEAQLNLKLLKALHLPTDYQMSAIIALNLLRLKGDIPKNVKTLLDPNKFNLIIHPGSNGNSKEWPLAQFQSLLQALPKDRFHIIINGSAAENERLGKTLSAACPEAINAMGTLSLNELIFLLSAADGLVVNSTGPLHIAAALGTKTLGLFPSNPGKSPERWGPIGMQAHYLAAPICIACKTKTGVCTCMQGISVEQVMDQLNAWLL